MKALSGCLVEGQLGIVRLSPFESSVLQVLESPVEEGAGNTTWIAADIRPMRRARYLIVMCFAESA